ncbi:MAG: prepilin-type N-terminal cleavage/methylation domain-containing protein [Bacilli bacterium]|nr:prepilin-type N-terminal cleavage/methylation domain-containing protein [Bacilli bacterium]MDD4809501.1 prepilin-type N-terminal cleavage/methylation domain-containing protein [Bacilli bacterium]
MKKGFTLIELLGVIVLLGVIGLIVIPSVTNLIKDSKQKLYDSQVSMIEKKAKEWAVKNINQLSQTENIYLSVDDLIKNGYIEQSELFDPRDSKNKMNGCIVIEYDAAKNKYQYTYNDEICEDLKPGGSSPLYVNDILGGADPLLDSGMIPIIWDGSKWVKADIGQKWYDYNLKEWANVVLVTEATRSTYKNAAPETEILESDVLAYLVWVPRYRYKLFNVNDVMVAEQTIEVVFENKDTTKSNGSTNGTWLTHPAFTFGGSELSGFWAGKFEATGNITSPIIKPGMESILGSANISDLFTSAQKFNNPITYGVTNEYDAHMMKNMEWGAVAYLSHSIYGKNAEIWSNDSEKIVTGGGFGLAYITNIEQSTTGNIYGIYDMNGCSFEAVMGGMYNSDGTTIMVSLSGFNQTTIDSAAMSKYINKYSPGTVWDDYSTRQLGDATSETQQWYTNDGRFVSTSYSWFLRGGVAGDGSWPGIFSFYNSKGDHGGATFRLVVTK